MSLSFASMWCYDYNLIWAWGCVQARTLLKHVKFGADWTLFARVTITLFHGETPKFVRLPGTQPLTKTQDLHNLKSQRPYDLTHNI